MVSQKVLITNPTGLHARPASEFSRFIKQFKSNVYLATPSAQVKCVSVINILTLAIKSGTTVEIKVSGEDEKQALPKIVEFLSNLKG